MLSGPPTPDADGCSEDESAATGDLQPFLWEQISSSIESVELEEVRRVVGPSLVSACEDIYAEVRALHEIHRDYAADTDEIIRSRASVPRSTASQPAGLVQLELKSLVSQLRARAAAAGVPEDALFPTPSSPQRKALDSVLHASHLGGGGADDERDRVAHLRPGTASSERVSLREMRLASRPSTASQSGSASRPPTSSAGSRPQTAATGAAQLPSAVPGPGCAGGSKAPLSAAHERAEPQQRPVAPNGCRVPPDAGHRAGELETASRPSSRGGRPRSDRPGSAASASSAGSVGRADEVGDGGGREGRSSRGGGGGGSAGGGGGGGGGRDLGGGGLVVSRLRAALEEERGALLAQAEGLRLAIDDEHDYRGRVDQPPPSLTSLLGLKKALQESLSMSEHRAALASAPPTHGAAHGRASLTNRMPLPEVRPSDAEHS